jgi:hypothetical protein
VSDAPPTSPGRQRRAFEAFANAALKVAARFRTVLARTSAADDLQDAVRLLCWTLPGGGEDDRLSPALVAEIRARCAAVAAHAWRVADAHAARVDTAAPRPRVAPSPLDGDAQQHVSARDDDAPGDGAPNDGDREEERAS